MIGFGQIYKICSPFTITSLRKMKRLHESVVYINNNSIEGDFVECGVYKGGSVMNMALSQLAFDRKVHIYLYDTFEGMTPSGDYDVSYEGITAKDLLRRRPKARCVCSLDQVKSNLKLTGYSNSLLHYHKGDVADTLKQGNAPEKVSLLRLDTDWYESTKIELEVLYPRLAKGGVLILDDYGYWKGARKATDDYFNAYGIKPNFKPIDEGIGAVLHIKL
jgi:hypothetical protein